MEVVKVLVLYGRGKTFLDFIIVGYYDRFLNVETEVLNDASFFIEINRNSSLLTVSKRKWWKLN